MDFKAEKKTIEGMLSARKQFCIPRFQREYSWGRQELKDFFEDIVGRIIMSNDCLDTTEYFFGSILLVGDINDQKNRSINVIDGQQRLTTITIFMSALYKKMLMAGEHDLANKVWEYIMSKDNDLKEYAILSNETPKPFFQFLIQTQKKYEQEPQNTEEENIIISYRYFLAQLEEKKLKQTISKNINVVSIKYIDLLKVVRDQLLRSVVVCICTPEIEYANMIFEILNAKGKGLASIDLIKNSLFELIRKEEPADEAKEKWKRVRGNLSSRGVMIDFSTFYRHFWIAKYSKESDNKLYSSFLSKIPKNEESYLDFLDELVKYSEIYVKILRPNIDLDFENHKHYESVVRSLYSIHNIFNVVQTRLVLMALYDSHVNKKIASFSQFYKTIKFFENFHLAYNAICSKRTSKLEKSYSDFAIALFKCNSNEQINECICKYQNIFLKLLPSKDEFITNFIKLSYSKEKAPQNILTRYILEKLEEKYSNVLLNSNIVSIEHIKDETDDNNITRSIGNLVILEKEINNNMQSGLSLRNKIPYYSKSKCKSIEVLLSNCLDDYDWDNSKIEKRAITLAEYYYDDIIIK